MNILLVLILVTLLVIATAVIVFFWAVNHQQFDDLDSPGILPLMDEPPLTDVTSAPASKPDSPCKANANAAGEQSRDPGTQTLM